MTLVALSKEPTKVAGTHVGLPCQATTIVRGEVVLLEHIAALPQGEKEGSDL